eukprot:jgi/Astpho2/1782/Aster-07544
MFANKNWPPTLDMAPSPLCSTLRHSGSAPASELEATLSELSAAPGNISDVPQGASTLQQAYLGPRRRLSTSSRAVSERRPGSWAAGTQELYTDTETLQDSESPGADSSGDEDAAAPCKSSRSRRRPRRTALRRFNCGDEEDSDVSDAEAGRVRRKHHNPWSLEETIALVNGVEACGGGKWADIKKRNYRAIEHRSAVDLKDKWRNLMRVAILPPHAVRTKCLKRREVPSELLDRVRKLSNITPGQKHVPGRRFVATSKTARSGARGRR